MNSKQNIFFVILVLVLLIFSFGLVEAFAKDTIDTIIEDEQAEIQLPRYGFTEEEVILLAQLVAGDKDSFGDGEYDFTWFIQNGQCYCLFEVHKVLNVVMNRVRSADWPDTVEGVVLQQGQFAVMPRNLQTDPCPLVIEVIRAWCDSYDVWDEEAQVIPENHLFFNAGPNNTNITRVSWRK